jgi:multimeric flavodoxin WrbA
MECKKTGRCVIDDDIRTVLDDMVDADCVVFSTPAYFEGPSALYKMVEDRMFSFLDADRESTLAPGKKAVLIVTSCYPDTDLQQVASILSRNLETIGFEMLGVITYCNENGTKPAEKNEELMHSVKKLGLKMRNTPTV